MFNQTVRQTSDERVRAALPGLASAKLAPFQAILNRGVGERGFPAKPDLLGYPWHVAAPIAIVYVVAVAFAAALSLSIWWWFPVGWLAHRVAARRLPGLRAACDATDRLNERRLEQHNAELAAIRALGLELAECSPDVARQVVNELDRREGLAKAAAQANFNDAKRTAESLARLGLSYLAAAYFAQRSGQLLYPERLANGAIDWQVRTAVVPVLRKCWRPQPAAKREVALLASSCAGVDEWEVDDAPVSFNQGRVVDSSSSWPEDNEYDSFPGVNTNGLPMIWGAGVDVGGNPYGVPVYTPEPYDPF